MTTVATSGSASHDRYEPIKRLAMVRLKPPANPDKPITSFSITDILNDQRFGSQPTRERKRKLSCPRYALTDLIRPWSASPPSIPPRTDSPDDPDSSPPPVIVNTDKHYYMLPSPRDFHSDHLTDTDDDEIEVDVTDDDDVTTPVLPTSHTKVSPLDALLNMTKSTFDAKSRENTEGMTDAKREQLNIFNKSQPSKKRRKSRTAFTNQQIYQLEKRFLYQKYLTPADRDELASGLDLSTAQVITWFQNRRAKLKRDLEELKADVTAAKSTDEEHQEILANANFNEQELFEKHGLRRCDRKESEDYDSHTYRNNHDDDQGQPRSQSHKRERTPSVDMPRLSPEMKTHERTT